MFYTIRKSSLIWGTVAVLMISFALGIMIKLEMDSAAPAMTEAGGIVIVIDPGHGGIDGGASNGDVLEKDLNLAVSLKLRDTINNDGNTAVLTRDSDEISMLNNTGGKYVKKDDLLYRLSVIDNSNADIFISIHMNKFQDSKYSGAQVFHSDNEDSKRLGELIQASLKNNLDSNNNRVAKGNEAGIYILKNAKIPAALIECGFLSNADELEKLQTDEYQQQLADAIYLGITEYLKAQ